jgi:hypothetical protein
MDVLQNIGGKLGIPTIDAPSDAAVSTCCMAASTLQVK